MQALTALAAPILPVGVPLPITVDLSNLNDADELDAVSALIPLADLHGVWAYALLVF